MKNLIIVILFFLKFTSLANANNVVYIDMNYILSNSTHGKSILDFYDKLRKKGLDKEASNLLDAYKKNIVTFKKTYDKILSNLL